MSDEVGTRRTPRSGEWTPAIGLRKLVLATLWRVPIVIAIAVVEFALLNWWYGAYAGAPIGHRGTLWVTVMAGCLLGAAMQFRLPEIAGFEGGVVTTASIAGLLAALALTYVIVQNLFTVNAATPSHILGVMAFGGAATILVLHLYHE